MFAYSFDSDGYFNGMVKRQKSPFQDDVFFLPANCVDFAPPEIGPDQEAKLVNGKWELVECRKAIAKKILEEQKRQEEKNRKAEEIKKRQMEEEEKTILKQIREKQLALDEAHKRLSSADLNAKISSVTTLQDFKSLFSEVMSDLVLVLKK